MDFIKDKFLKQLWAQTSDVFETLMKELEEQGDAFNKEMADELTIQMKHLLDKYSKSAFKRYNRPIWSITS